MLPQSVDTHIEIEKIQLAMIRRESISKRFSRLCSLSKIVRQLSKRAVKRANPALNHQELEILFVRYLYGSELADRFCNKLSHKKAMKTADIITAAKPLAKVFEELAIPYYIGGSIASSVYGMPRATQDVDVVTDLKFQHIPFLIERLESDYYIDEEMISEAISKNSCFNLLHLDTMIKIDVFVVKNELYQKTVFERKRQETLDEEDGTLRFYLASSEDIVLTKLNWFRIGGFVSEQQWRDILGILKVQKESLDIKYLLRWAKELGLHEILAKAFQEVDISS